MGCVEPTVKNPDDSIVLVGNTGHSIIYKVKIDGKEYIVTSNGGITPHVPE